MQVNLNNKRINTTNFGMAIKTNPNKTKSVKNYLFKNINSIEDTIKLNKYIESQRHNKADIYLSTENGANISNEKLKANVGGKEIVGTNPLNVIKRAIAYANKYNNEKLADEAIHSGTNKIISKLS